MKNFSPAAFFPFSLCYLLAILGAAPLRAGEIQADLSAFHAGGEVQIQQDGSRLRAEWPMAPGEYGVLSLELQPGKPLIRELAIAKTPGGPAAALLKNVNPVHVLTVGTRDLKQPGGWTVFFDSPPKRSHQSYLAALDIQSVRAVSAGPRATLILDGLSAGPFRGDLRFTFYPGTRLLQVQAVVSTSQDAVALLYDTGLASGNDAPAWDAIAYMDNQDQWRRIPAGAEESAAEPVAVRQRTIIAEAGAGSVAIFPPPHQFLYPLDFADNFKLVWHGRGYHDGLVGGWGFGVRQPPQGDGRFVPWINAPPGSEQRLGVFYLLSGGKGETALEEVRRYTRGDHFKKLDGYHTFSSHYHVEHTLDFLAQQKKQQTSGVPRGLEEPGFVKTFRARGVDIVHLAEFHVGETPRLPTAERLLQLKTLHAECARLSDDRFLLLPGEEPNVHLGGHWLSFFPRPVYWTLNRAPGQPFVEQIEGHPFYHVGSAEDVLHLMETEHGLMWTAHPRIKGSLGFPDGYRTRDFFLSDRFLGGAWKAMPSDLSKDRLGTRVLDLEDDMANWGLRKYIVGEVDVFKISPASELYGHMNINYLALDKVPRFPDGWQSVLDTLRAGRFFVTTGEVLIPAFRVGGKHSGETLHASAGGGASPATTQVEASLEWTFPLAFAEVISGDGKTVRHQRIDLTDTPAFGARTLKIPVDLAGQKWVRLEVWDAACNGAFTEPVWIE